MPILTLTPIFAGVIDWIKWPFGWLLRMSYELTHSYVFAIVVFAVVIRLVLLPVSIKQQKGMIAQAKLRPKEMRIRNKYKGRNDKATQEKLNAEIMELYSKEHYSPLSGCLPLVLQMAIILILFYVVTAPIKYVVADVYKSDVYFTAGSNENVVDETVNKVIVGLDDGAEYRLTAEGEVFKVDGNVNETPANANAVSQFKTCHEAAIRQAVETWFGENQKGYPEINFMNSMKNGAANNDEKVEKLIKIIPDTEKILDFNGNLFGLDLLQKPEFFNWLLLIPILSVIISFLSARISKKLNSVAPAPGSTDAAASLKVMEFAMPLFSGYIAFIVPGSVGFYWMISNLLMIVQSFLLAKLYPIPNLDMIEAEFADNEKKEKKNKKNKNTAEAELNGEPIDTASEMSNGISIGNLKDNSEE